MTEDILDGPEINKAKPNYRKWLRTFEIVSASLILIGFLFKTMHWKWGVELVLFSSIFLSFLYLIFFFKLISQKTVSRVGFGLSLFAGFIISTTVLVILFRIMLWPGFGDVTQIGWVCLLLIGAFGISAQKNVVSKQTLKSASARLLLVGGIAIALHFTSIRAQIGFYYDNVASDKLLDSFVDQYENPNNEEMRERYNRLRVQHMDSLYGY